jgi:hypothetical protein
LRNGGRLVVTVPFGLNAFHDHKQTYYPLTLLELIQPLLRTETIDTLNNYILYSGVKDASYTPGAVSPDERWLTALRLHRLVEDRCLQKERELLGSATEFHKQLKTLTTQSAAQRQAIEDLETELKHRATALKNQETALKNREQEVAELRTLTSKLKRTAEDARQAAASTQQAHSGEMQAAQANAARLEAQARELESRATSSAQRIDELTRLLEQAQAASVAVQELAKHAELEHTRRLQDLATQSVSQAKSIQALELTVANKDLRIQDLSASLEQAHASLLELRSASESLQQTQAAQVRELTDRIRELTDRIREQSATLDHLQHLLRVQDQQITESKAACEETREKLLTATRTLSQLQQEFLNSQASVRELEANRDAQLRQLAAHAAELQAKDDERRREFESLATRHARDIRAREIQIKDLNALLAARDKEHQRELEAATKQRDVDWERRLMNQRIRALVRDKLPADAHVLVISKGDEDLLRLDGRHGEHFPQTTEGIYAGHHPGSSQEAIQHLESLRGKGARYLLVPQTSFWWLEFYRELREHLDTRARLIAFDETTAALYQLEPPPSNAPVYATVAARKNGATEKTVKARPAQRPQIPAPAPTVPKPVQRAAPDEPPQIGVILDEFTMGCLAPECHLLTFRPDNWRQKLEARPPRALFVESAWRGNEGAWLYRVAQYPRNMGNELSELLHWARDQKIPSVFWNKEDPVHFERLI